MAMSWRRYCKSMHRHHCTGSDLANSRTFNLNPIVGSSGQSILYKQSVPCKIQVGPRHSTHQEGGIGCSGSIQLPSDYQPGHYFQDAREAGSGSSDLMYTCQSSSVQFQPAYRRRHSTETALIRVVNDLNSSMESGSKSILLSLDILVAFDTIDTDKLLQRLE